MSAFAAIARLLPYVLDFFSRDIPRTTFLTHGVLKRDTALTLEKVSKRASYATGTYRRRRAFCSEALLSR